MQIQHKNYHYFDGSKKRAGIVMARFNQEITEELLKSALEALRNCKVAAKNIKVVKVAGSVEMPFALHKLAKSGKYDFLVALGCIIRGDTSHFDYVCKMAQEGVLKVMIEDSIPVGFGVLTLDTLGQAKKRFHVGGEAVLAALELSQLE